jgi:hypothetical protein
MQQAACSKKHWCHAACTLAEKRIGAMQQLALTTRSICFDSKQHWHTRNIGVMQQAALAGRSIGAMQQAALASRSIGIIQ